MDLHLVPTITGLKSPHHKGSLVPSQVPKGPRFVTVQIHEGEMATRGQSCE